MNSPQWADAVRDAMTARFPSAEYYVKFIEPGDVEGSFRVRVEGKESKRDASFDFENWLDEVRSIGRGSSSFDAFVGLLRAHVDERWSELGGWA